MIHSTIKRLLEHGVLAMMLLLGACVAPRSAADHSEWSVLLKEEAPADHLTLRYQTPYALQTCQRVSRSENRWQVSMPSSKSAKRKVIRAMSKDTLILEMKPISQEPHQPTNDQNVGHSKSKPIRNQQ